MSTKHKQKHRKKSAGKRTPPFKTPSVITNTSEDLKLKSIIHRDIGTETNGQSVPLPSFDDGSVVLDDISEHEVQQIRGKYTGQYEDPYKLRGNGHSSTTNKLYEIQNTDPYNRRESFLADINHEPYWQDKEAGSHPFQTPKSTKNNPTPVFFKQDVVQNTDTNAQQGYNPLLVTEPMNNNRESTSSSVPTKESIPEENELIQMMPSVASERDIYSIDDNPNHNGRITTYARNGELNPISLYKLEANRTKLEQEEESYEEESQSDEHENDGHIKQHSAGHNKRIITNSFLSSPTETNPKKKVSFGPPVEHVIISNTNTPNGVGKLPTNLSSPSLSGNSNGPQLLIQSTSNDNLEQLQPMNVMAQLTPNAKTNMDGTEVRYQYPNTSKTAPASPNQKKLYFSPQVSSIKNQRHSVVSIAMIQKIREKKMLLEAAANSGASTPSLSVGSLDEEYDHDEFAHIEASYFDSSNRSRTVPASSHPHLVQRSGTEDDILHKNAKPTRGTAGKMRKYRNGAQSTSTSPKHKGFKWQKKAHSYRPQKERYTGSDTMYTMKKHAATNETINTNNYNHPNMVNNTSPPLRRTHSDLTKRKNNKQRLLQEYKVPPATGIIHERHAKITPNPIHMERDTAESKADAIPSLFADMSKKIVKSRMGKLDIENLIPLTVSRFISYNAEKTGNLKLTPPQRWDFTTVAMFADVSGFTALSEHLAKAGAGGAEKLAFYLNRYLEQLANKARKEGGDVFKFAGDAIIIVWPPDFEEEKLDESRQHKLREERIARAVQAARAIQNEFHMAEIIKGAITLSVKIGIGYGPSSLLFVGGQFGRIEYLLCGSALKQAFDCEGCADPGDVVISKEAYKYVKEKYVYGRAVNNEKTVVVTQQINTPKSIVRAISASVTERGTHSNQNSLTLSNGSDNGHNLNKVVQEPIAYKVMLDRKKYKKVHSKALRSGGRYLISEHLQPFVPRAAWQRLVLRFKPWHGEQRAVTVLFINLDFNAYDSVDDENEATKSTKKKRSNLENVPQTLLQKAVKTTQKCIYRYKGSLNKFLFDDKGSTVIAVFGLPPIANFDDCTRAVLAALLIEQKMKTLRIKARIGVTTGRVYIGVVGAAGSASEYGILGDQVNLAARLMQHAIKKQEAGGLGGEGVVVSDTTYAQAKECINIDWQRLQSTSVKGFSKEFIIWRPHWRKIKGDLSMKRNRFFIGWKETMDEVKSRLLKLTQSDVKSRGYVIAIHTDHWGGATQFARQLLHEIHQSIYVVGTTNLAFNDEKLFAWKALLARIVRECRILRPSNIEDEISYVKFQKSFIRFMCDTGGERLIPYLPVLNELLGTRFVSDAEHEEIMSLIPKRNSANGAESTRFGHQKLKSYTPSKQVLSDEIVAENKRRQSLLLSYRVEIICHLLRQVSKYSTMVIIISKLQYMDLDDWAITRAIAKNIHEQRLFDVSLVLAGWSMDTKSLTYLISPEEKQVAETFNEIRRNTCWLEFVLPKWTKQEVRDFLKFEFDIEKPSKNVLHFIVNKTDGIPGMIKCLVHDQSLLFLKHGGHLDCSQIERCRDIQSGSRYSDINLPIPYAIQSYYTKMLDSLDQFALLTIKCAAVIAVGQEFLSVAFSYDMLFSCHPLRSDINNHKNDTFSEELHAALSLLEKDRFVYKFKQDKLTQEMIRLSDLKDQNHKHDNETFYVFASGFLRDVTYCNMLYKQRSAIHKRVKAMLDREPFNIDELVQQCIRRHHLLSLHDGFYSNRDEVERKREEILATNSKTNKSRLHRMDQHHSIWSFPECVLVLYVQDVGNLPDLLKSSSYITIHIGDDKGKSLTQSMRCYSQYLSVVLSENILKQIEDETVGPVLTMRLWYKQNYRVAKTIGTFTLRLRELYEKQLSEQMLWLQRKSELALNERDNMHNPRGSKRNSLNNMTKMNNGDAIYDHTDLFVGYKMNIHVKQKKINRFNLDKQLYIESFIRFCSVDDGSKMQHNLETVLPFAAPHD